MKRPLPLQFRDVVGSKISVILSVNRPLDGVLLGGRDRTLMVKMLGKEKVMRGHTGKRGSVHPDWQPDHRLYSARDGRQPLSCSFPA